MGDIRIATRGSRLAMAQARWVSEQLSKTHPDLEISLVEVTTSGDTDRSTPVTTLTEVGAFVRAVQQTVLEGRADIAVHSCKDLPVEGPAGLARFYPEREKPWDVLCGHDLDSLPCGARVGTGSPRRAAQMKRLRPDVQIEDIRGNVDTRLEEMRSGEYDAVILAEAGLLRLGREGEIGHRFSLTEMVPAPAQAALAVETREDGPATAFLAAIDDPATRTAVLTERALLGRTGAGCRSALGALADVRGRTIRATGFVEEGKGARSGHAVGSDPVEVAISLQAVLGL